MKFSLCIEPLFTDTPCAERLAVVAEAGFDAVEFWDPAGKDLAAIRAASTESGLPIAACTLVDPWKVRLDAEPNTFSARFQQTLPLARSVGCATLICLTGSQDAAEGRKNQTERIVHNLSHIAAEAEEQNILIVLEALNSRVDHHGYFLDSSDAGFAIVREVGSPNVKLLYDIYHMQIMEGNIISTIADNIELIGHFHSAGVPGRHELTTGELNYGAIIQSIKDTGYDGYFGVEYWPSRDHRTSIEETARFLERYR